MRRLVLAAVLAIRGLATADEPPVSTDASAGKPRFTFRAILSDWEPTRDRGERDAELLYASAAADWKIDKFGLRAEVRAREGRFRPYFDSPVWLEEGYGFVQTPVGELRVGKLPRGFGVEDVTFAGNLFSRNGVSRNPDFGAGIAGSKGIGWDTLTWTVAYFGQNDRVAWEEDGRGVESDRSARLRDAFSGRATYRWNKGLVWVTPGVSIETGRIVSSAREFRRTDLAVELTLTLGPLALLGTFFRRNGETDPTRLAYGDSSAGMLEFRAEFPTVLYRYTYSEWSYRDLGASERIHQPGVVWTGIRPIEATIEFQARRFRIGSVVRVDNGFRLGLCLKL